MGKLKVVIIYDRVLMEHALALNPNSPPTHYNLGIALSMQRKVDEAIAEFREAVRLDDNYADAHNNLGAMLHVSGRLDEKAVLISRMAFWIVRLVPAAPRLLSALTSSEPPVAVVPPA